MSQHVTVRALMAGRVDDVGAPSPHRRSAPSATSRAAWALQHSALRSRVAASTWRRTMLRSLSASARPLLSAPPALLRHKDDDDDTDDDAERWARSSVRMAAVSTVGTGGAGAAALLPALPCATVCPETRPGLAPIFGS